MPTKPHYCTKGMMIASDDECKLEEPPSKQSKLDSGKQPRSQKKGALMPNSSSKVDSLVTEMTEDEVTGPAISEKITNVLNNILARVLNEQATLLL
ncbi:hypothetical protein OS493_017666 [Desmophyllum pertusum]|uniref:Uncharacterized protein n=1 Tax=Desmophyllum pertusum TaxID=174260 RepID=A0A9X0CYL5_9CNID|nr:hypothetical protein OS493_017666 [Desmophyllum pertusum]